MGPVPVPQDGKFGRVNIAIALIHEREVHSGQELNPRRLIWIVLPACNLQAVDAVLMYRLYMRSGRARKQVRVDIHGLDQ